MNRKQKAAAIALSAVMACGIFAGCDLTTTNTRKDLSQIIATVNIADSKTFKTDFEGMESAVETAEVTKLEMVMSYISNGGDNLINSYGDAKKAFDAIANSLVQRQIYLQYAKVYFLKNGWDNEKDKNDQGKPAHVTYTVEGYNAAVADKTGTEREIAGLGYFLTEEEKAVALYNLRLSMNNMIDSFEKDIIDEEEDVDYETNVRTTPTGANTANSDYYDSEYRVYTGTGAQAEIKGSYEKVTGSTASYRKRAYFDFISQVLHSNNLIEKGENTGDIENLGYFRMQLRNNYSSMLIQKLGDTFTKKAEEKITEQYCEGKFNETLQNQEKDFGNDISALESALDGMSDNSFVLTAPKDTPDFGFVINILLPFSAAQSDVLSAADKDFGDDKGNKFSTRAALLQNITATDQRGSWFTGETDYSFDAKDKTDAKYYTGTLSNQADRSWLFFEDNFVKDKYEVLKNYYGQYTYNGTYNADKRVYKPTPIKIDGFLDEMEGYLEYVLGANSVNGNVISRKGDAYYTQRWYKDNTSEVDFSRFVYAAGKVNFDNFNANNMFVAGSQENKAFSAIKELSFAYNTDTAGLNDYLGYAITANKTSFVDEFEYASQEVVKAGAGNYMVVPSDYGWHIIYCTFSFSANYAPFVFDWSEIENEGSFSNLFYESIKADTASTESSNRQTKMLASYDDSYEIFESKYKNLTSSN